MTPVIDHARLEGWVSCPRCSRRARAGQPFCESCGDRLTSAESAASETRRTLACPECGATSQIPEGERTASCPFCAAAFVSQGEAAGRHAPEFLLPFSITESKAQEKFHEWIGRFAFFAPDDLSRKASVGGLRGVYVPFWSFSMRSDSAWRARLGEYWYETVTETYTTTENGKTLTRTRTKQVRHTEWYPLDGRFHQFHSHYLVCASKGLTQDSAERIQPFPVGELTRYAPHYLSGWLAEEYFVDRESAMTASTHEFRERELRDIREFLPGDTSADLEASTEFHDVTEDLVYLPIWILAYRYREKVFQFVLNGATGEGHGDKPVSAWKVAFFVLIVIAIIIAVVFLLSSRSGG